METLGTNSQILCDDGTVKENSAMAQWGKIFDEGGRKLGRTFQMIEQDVQLKGMAAAGFVDIQYKDYYVPMGGWGNDKEAAERGLWWKIALEADLEGKPPFVLAACIKRCLPRAVHGSQPVALVGSC